MSDVTEQEQIRIWHRRFSALAELTKDAARFSELADRYRLCREFHPEGVDPWETVPGIIDLAEKFATALDQFFYDPEKHEPQTPPVMDDENQAGVLH